MFVDDEQRVLAGIKRALFMQNRDWECDFANDGRDALARLDQEPADVVVSDMRMPFMNGAELLKRVKERWPTTIRIILSGQMDENAAMLALDVAHQFLSKPCDAAQVFARVERAIALRTILDEPGLLELVGRLRHLPSAPKIYFELMRLVANPAADTRDLVAIIGRDPALCAKLLQLANSAFFNSGKTIESISGAVARLGFATVRMLALSSEVFGNAKSSPEVEALQQRSLLASLLAGKLSAAGRTSELASNAAMLAEIGYLVTGIDPHDGPAETSVHLDHCRHAEIGAYLLGLWNLPLDIVEAVAHHCSPMRVQDDVFETVGVVHVAVSLADGKQADLEYLHRTGQMQNWARWQSMADELRGAVA